MFPPAHFARAYTRQNLAEFKVLRSVMERRKQQIAVSTQCGTPGNR